MAPTTVVYPDYQGKATESGFHHPLLEKWFVVIPVFNGLAKPDLEALTRKYETETVHPASSVASGLAPALIAGYSTAADCYPDSVVVRLDTAEHDPNFIPVLARSAATIPHGGGMVVGDLRFTKETLLPGTIDEFAHLNLFPTLYQHYAGVPVSCAHGYQAFNPNTFRNIFNGAQRISEVVEEMTSQKPTWGFDGAMILSAAKQRYTIGIVPIPAQSIRNRDQKKIANQFEKALLMCRASERAFHD